MDRAERDKLYSLKRPNLPVWPVFTGQSLIEMPLAERILFKDN
ncbi:hypothetical protein B601_0747 [Chlamydia psittaci WS/RT/E30]|nr:hypothetical protein B601_0747 [Chlamydia psittaci WS/RT/E30]